MTDLRFFLVEFLVTIVLIFAALASYMIFLSIALVLPRDWTIILWILKFIQAAALNITPLILTLMKREGLAKERVGERYLEELAFHTVRYNLFIRPAVGYLGVYFDAFCLLVLTALQGHSIRIFNIGEAAQKRASGNGEAQWVALVNCDSGPVTAWRDSLDSIHLVLDSIDTMGPSDSASFGDAKCMRGFVLNPDHQHFIFFVLRSLSSLPGEIGAYLDFLFYWAKN